MFSQIECFGSESLLDLEGRGGNSLSMKNVEVLSSEGGSLAGPQDLTVVQLHVKESSILNHHPEWRRILESNFHAAEEPY